MARQLIVDVGIKVGGAEMEMGLSRTLLFALALGIGLI